MRIKAAIFLLLFGMSLPSLANKNWHELDDIRHTAETYVQNLAEYSNENSHAQVGSLDSRLHLSSCDKDLSAFLLSGTVPSGNMTIGVRCTGTNPWKIYVAVKIQTFSNIIVLARPVSQGHNLMSEDIKLEKRDISRMSSGYFNEKSLVIGKVVKRSMTMGSVLNRNSISVKQTIKRGQMVTLLASTPGFEIRVEGKALSDAGSGETVKVRNLSSKRVVEGIVVGEHEVKVNL